MAFSICIQLCLLLCAGDDTRKREGEGETGYGEHKQSLCLPVTGI